MDLVVGIGNELRSDDGVGIRVVRALPARRGVETTTVHQLTPDLIEALGRAERVLFVDAHASETRLRLARLAQREISAGIGHALGPEALIAWTSMTCGRAPEGWMLSIPVVSFAVGEELSAEVARELPAAQDAVLAWLDRAVETWRSEEDA